VYKDFRVIQFVPLKPLSSIKIILMVQFIPTL